MNVNNNGNDDDLDRSDSNGSSTRKRTIEETMLLPTMNKDFVNKFKRIRACARCHRLKMKCVFEDPSFESCTRCFKAGIQCSVTDDPTLAYAKSRPRKRSKLKGTGVLGQLQLAINESNKLLLSFQRGEVEKSDAINLENLSTLQFQLSETQRLILHTMNSQKGKDFKENKDKSKPELSEASSINSIKEGVVKSIPSLPWISHNQNIMKEIIKLEIITQNDAIKRTNYFFNELHSYWPCVSFPKHYKYEWLLENEPLVLLSFITVTSLNDPDLHDTLLYYLEDNLSVRTSITGNISFSFIQIYLVLSLWCSPPRKWGSYKHQMSLLMALNLTLCLDLGNEVYKNTPNVLKDGSPERHMIRSYMAVYSCCGSLGLSLPRFKVVNWTPVHEKCCQLLLMGEVNDADKFLYFYSKLVSLGEEIFQFLCPNGFPNISVRKNSSVGSDSDSTINNSTLRSIMVGYEKKMQKLAVESNLFSSSSKMRNLLSIIYYQLLMTMYDYIVCRVLLRRDVLTEVYLQTLNRLIKASEKVIDSFVTLCDQTLNFPTFFYYRPMHALVALIRARLLVKTQQLDFEVNVEGEHDKVYNAINKLSKDSKVANKMGAILTRISKWMKVSSKFNKNGATNSMVDLLNELGREKAIEKIKINIDVSEDNGDNKKLSNNSKIQFNKMINYNLDNNMNPGKSQFFKRRTSKQLLSSEGIDPSLEDRSNSNCVPSPIGYSHSEILDSQQKQLGSTQPITNILNREEGDNSQINTPVSITSFTSIPNNMINNNFKSKTPSLSESFFSRYPTLTQQDMDNISQNSLINGNLRGNRGSLSEAMEVPTGTPESSFAENSLNNNNINTSVSDETQFQQQLNDIFSHIDTDIMNLDDSAPPNGLGMPPMFDFLGTLGFQTNSSNDLNIPEDWYKSI